jgi:hypothetical protein
VKKELTTVELNEVDRKVLAAEKYNIDTVKLDTRIVRTMYEELQELRFRLASLGK